MIEFLKSDRGLNFIQSLGVIVTLALTIAQWIYNNRIVKSQIFNSVYQRLDAINTLALDEKISNKYSKTFDPQRDEYNPFNSFIDMVGTFFYEMYYHHKRGLLNKSEWKTWDKTIADFYSHPYVRGYWLHKQPEHGYGFDDHVKKLLKDRDEKLKNALSLKK